MIRSESEYEQALVRLQQEKQRIAAQKRELKGLGLSPAEIKRATDPVRSFHLQLADEVRQYERLKQGDITQIANLRGLGPLLVSLRIARGLTQRQLAEKLETHESQVSRDERNEYHGVTLERAARILEALGAKIRIQASIPGKPNGREAVA